MSDENRIEFSESGKAEHRELWALAPITDSATIRGWTMNLLADLRDRYSTAEVWINGRKFSPTPEELDAYRKHLSSLLQKESLLRAQKPAEPETPDVVVIPEKPQPAPKVTKRELPLPTASNGLLIDPRALESDLDF